MKIGIIGGNGFVGSGIRAFLEKENHHCTVITRENYQTQAGQSFDVLINANGNSKKYLSASSPKEEFQASVNSVQHSLLDFSYERYIHCSSVDVYPNHEDLSLNTEEAHIDVAQLSYYGLHKYLAEQLVRRYAKEWIILRFGGFVGNGLKKNSIYDMLNNVPLRVNIDSEYQYFPTEQAGKVISILLERRVTGEIFNVCGDGVVSLRQVMQMIPGYAFSYAGEEPKKERYEVNIGKLKNIVLVPSTKDTVEEFLRPYRQKA